jgi:hypothetical protein
MIADFDSTMRRFEVRQLGNICRDRTRTFSSTYGLVCRCSAIKTLPRREQSLYRAQNCSGKDEARRIAANIAKLPELRTR